MRRLTKVTRFFSIITLALLVFVLGFAAKHGQFEPSAEHGHFLSKSVKMESLALDLSVAVHFDTATVPLHFKALYWNPPPSQLVAPLNSTDNLSLPILI